LEDQGVYRKIKCKVAGGLRNCYLELMAIQKVRWQEYNTETVDYLHFTWNMMLIITLDKVFSCIRNQIKSDHLLRRCSLW